jgi:general L-amino acid transport system substrate-binding protein
MLGLVDMWTLLAIRAAGNYAEIYEQNHGVEAQLSIPRDLIQLWSIGGVLYAAPIR